MMKAESSKQHEIQICMGSSCFSRGNNRNLRVIQSFLRENGVEAQVKVIGNLCVAECRSGPNLRIDGVLYREVDPNACLDLLQSVLPENPARNKSIDGSKQGTL